MSTSIYKPVNQNGKENNDKLMDDEKTRIPDLGVVDTRCGFWFIKPAVLQPCANIGLFTTFYSMAALVTSTLSTYVTSQITTLERQFGFTSQQTGVIMAANDIGYLVCVLFVSYSASRLHIPRSLGTATVIFGFSGIACSLPHFIFGTSQDSQPNLERLNSSMASSSAMMTSAMFGALCDASNVSRSSCDAAGANRSITIGQVQVAKASLVIIVIGMMLQGFGKAPRSSLTITYLDDNTEKSSTGFYMGIVATIGILGPAVAFLMGGVFSKIYVTLQPTNLTPRHPKWIGAWWLGYVLFGLLALLVSVPLFFFPRRLIRKEKQQQENADNNIWRRTLTSRNNTSGNKPPENANPLSSEFEKPPTHETVKVSKLQRFGHTFFLKHLKEFLVILLRLWTNPIYISMVTSGCFLIFTIGGSSSYTPKYLERMFHLPAHKANYIIAGQTLCTSCLGTFIGGYLTKRMKMTAMKAMKFVIVVVAISLFGQLMGFVFQCDQPDVHSWPSQNNSCIKGCNCEDNSYFPICGDDGRTYYSPCHAGCGVVENGIYQNCTCIPGGGATSGICDYSCPHLYAYVAFMGVRSLFGTVSMIPKMIIFIRCVSHADRPMAMGVSSFMMSLLGWLLGPIVFGNVIDGICTIWDMKCGVRGRCLRYDNDLFRLKLHGFGSVGLACSLLFICVAFAYAKWTKCLDEPKETKEEAPETVAEAILLGNYCNKNELSDDD